MSDDLISRQAAIDAINKNRDSVFHDSVHYEDAVYDISNLPSAQPEQKKGRWVPGRKIGKEILTDGTIAVVYEDYKCSSCGLILYRLLHNNDGTPFYKFCPNCGTWMGGDQDDSLSD